MAVWVSGAAYTSFPSQMVAMHFPLTCQPAKGVAADDTLEARLEAQHDWFLENAGLEINI